MELTIPMFSSVFAKKFSGDMNPLHADPAIASAAGFERPILHGRCTMGVAMHALVRSCCDYDASRLRSMQLPEKQQRAGRSPHARCVGKERTGGVGGDVERARDVRERLPVRD